MLEMYSQRIDEMKRKGYNPSYTNTMLEDYAAIPPSYWKDWTPDE
jgi:hypothetical protein